jgi:adenine-specific DNA-methyltransferase
MTTPYHAKYFAHELTKRHSANDPEKFAGTLVDAQVDLNPHQVDAALFAFSSPLSRGALLADEVGLGKTIEAGMVISQRWAERKRRILVITPSNLRKQWFQELQEKFFLPCQILETKSYNQFVRDGHRNPFNADSILICSYHFARQKSANVSSVPWDLVVIDEAHRLRNVYKKSNKIANELRDALKGVDKLLLTATPLQNSLLELYGLVSFIDEYTFGDLNSFREQFSDLSDPFTFKTLKARLKPICQRTLRSQVLPYINYTKRFPMLEEFTPNQDEAMLYDMVSDYLRKPELQALPSGQRQLLTLVLRKLLASSTFAIAGALDKMAKRLQKKLDESNPVLESLEDALDEDFESLDELSEEWEQVDEGTTELTDSERKALETEIAELKDFYDLAVSITENSKGLALLNALKAAFSKAKELGAEPKALVFTESRRTQEYLLRLLSDTVYRDGIVLFNGSNNDEKSKQIYTEWLSRYQNTDRITGSRSADMRSALVDYFRETGQIMIATEAGAEGINLQFCSLVINYDLPWNPQRVEQRIGRCHRYGQKYDVVVVNFLNKENAADQRVYELLAQKFQLFAGVFGASDEVLGVVESAAVPFEKRIAEIYQNCRTPEEINASFDQLQEELSAQIMDAMTQAQKSLLEHFDDEVKEKLRVRDVDTKQNLNRYEKMLMQLTEHELDGYAEFRGDSSFILKEGKYVREDIPVGLYELPRRSGDAHFYRLAHPLAQQVIEQAKSRSLSSAELVFQYSDAQNKISVLENMPVKQGWSQLSLLTVESLSQTEDRLIWTAFSDDGKKLEDDIARRLFDLPARIEESGNLPERPVEMSSRTDESKKSILSEISVRNAQIFESEINKLEAWSDDRKVMLEREIKEYDRRIKESRRSATAAITLEEKLAAQKEVKSLEKERTEKRRALFQAQDEIDAQRDNIIKDTEDRMKYKDAISEVFCIRWKLM